MIHAVLEEKSNWRSNRGCGEYEVMGLVGTVDIEEIDLPVFTHNGTLTFTNTKIEPLWIGI
jgi:hypothetical protein